MVILCHSMDLKRNWTGHENWTGIDCISWTDLQIITHPMQNSSANNELANVSGLNESQRVCFQPRPGRHIFVIVILDLMLSILSVVGNVLVAFAVLRYRQLRNVTNVFVLGLAAADLLVGLNIPYYVLFYFDLQALSCQRISCLLRYWFTIYASGCSMLCLVGVAVDRYIAILYPLSYPRILRTRHASLYIGAVWAWMGVISSLPLLGIGDQFHESKECDLYYTHTKEYALAAVASVVLFTLAATTVLNLMIFKEAWRHKRAVVALEVVHRVRQETKTARMMALVMGVNFLGFLPYLTVITLRYVNNVDQERIAFLKPFAVMCYFGKSAINPVIYGWKNKDFRVAFKKLLTFDRTVV